MLTTNRRTLIAGVSAFAVAAVCAAAASLCAKEVQTRCASDTEIRIGHTNPYSGNASAYGAIGKTPRRPIFKYDQRTRRHQWPQDHFHHAMTTDTAPPKDRRDDCASSSKSDQGAALPSHQLGTAPNVGHSEVHEPARRCRSCSSRPASSKWGKPKEISRGRWVGSPTTHTEGRDLCQAHPRRT